MDWFMKESSWQSLAYTTCCLPVKSNCKMQMPSRGGHIPHLIGFYTFFGWNSYVVLNIVYKLYILIRLNRLSSEVDSKLSLSLDVIGTG